MTTPPTEGAHGFDGFDDEVVYDLGDWTFEQRAELERSLEDQRLAYRWHTGDQLLVPEVHADLVDEMVDDIDHPDALTVDDVDVDDRGAEILSDLYVASDVLLGAPGNPAAAARARAAAAAAALCEAPYGLDVGTWAGVRQRAGALVEELGAGDEQRTVAAARALREAVRPLV